MSYDQWKTGMWTTGAVSAVVGSLIWIFWGSGGEALLVILLILLLITLVVLSLQKPKRVWAVAAEGTSNGRPLSKSYGPFHSKEAAVAFRNGWDEKYEGFAVVECRDQIKK